MKTAFLHVGLPKTGSTSIQDFLFTERAALEEEGVLFPSPTTATREARIAAGEGWGRHASILAAMQGRWDDLAPGEWPLWQAEFARFGESDRLHTVIISHETIGNRAGQFNLALLRELLGGYRLRIMMVVREAEAWLASLYEQRISGRRRLSDPADRFSVMAGYLRGGLRTRVEALQTAFPGAELLIPPFETLVTGEGLVSNTAALIPLTPALRAKGAAAKQSNVSLSQERIEVLRRCNVAGLPMDLFVEVRRTLTAAQRRSKVPRKPRRRVFGPETAQRIGERYEADRAWLLQEFGVGLPAQRAASEPFALADADLEAIIEESRPFLSAAAHERFAAAARAVPDDPSGPSPLVRRSRR